MKQLRAICLAGLAVGAVGSVSAATLQGQVLHLDGAGDYVEVADSPDLHSAAALTITAWFRLDDEARSWQALVWKGDLPDHHPWANREFGLYCQSRGYVHLCSAPVSRFHAGQLYLDTPGGLVRPEQWYHVAAVLNSVANAMQIYLDGELVASRPYDRSGLRDTTGPLRLGGIPGTGAELCGLLDEVRIWGRALSDAEVRADLDPLLGPAEPDLLAHYSFDCLDAAGRVPDLSGRGHSGALVGDAGLQTIGVHLPSALAAAPAPMPLRREPGPDSGPVVTTTTVTSSADGGTTTTTTTVPLLVPAASPDVPAPAPALGGDAAYLLVQALGSQDTEVRRHAAGVLDRLDSATFAPVMKVALESPDPYVRRRAAAALVASGPEQWRSAAGDGYLLAACGGTAGCLPGSTAAPPLPRPPEAKAVRAGQPARYGGWEHKWSAPRPDFWDLEPEGLRLRYDRVEGLYAGWQVVRAYRQPRGLAHFGEAGYSLAGEQWSYQAGGEVFTFYGPPVDDAHLATVGAELHEVTDTQDGWLVSEEENSLAAALFRRDFRDYYRRSGWSAYTSHNIGGVLQVTGRYGRDDFGSLEAQSDWVLFESRFSRSAFRPNPGVDEGAVASVRADLQVDTRDGRGAPRRGWFANALFERAGGVLGGQYRFKRYLADLRRYQPVGRGTRLDARLRVGTAKGDLPRQYLYDLGGLSSLRGYGFKASTGDRMVLANIEYWVDGDAHFGEALPVDGLGLGVFVDAGSVWWARDRGDPFEGVDGLVGVAAGGPRLKRSFGFALSTADDGFRVDLARPLDRADGGWQVYARLSRAL
ncbi:MAG: LamG-like jellyroll fold domain-containing protein [Gemmatimonadota bacterium]